MVINSECFVLVLQKKKGEQVKSTCYLRSSQARAIRKKMVDIMTAEASKVLLRDLVKKFIPESIGKEIEKECLSIFPLRDVIIRKVKIIKKPKFDVTRLMELHGESKEDGGKKMVHAEAEDAKNILTAEIKQ